jgi:hypothetical protein
MLACPSAAVTAANGPQSCSFIQQLYPYVCNGFLRPGRCGNRDRLAIRMLNQGFNGRLTIR